MSVLHHSCHSCGGSCQGVTVRLVDEGAIERMTAFGGALGVDSPVVEGRLRQSEDGRCVFLDDHNLCRIHAEFGADSKPRICQQYPLVLLRTESGERKGIDPGCYSAFGPHTDSPPILPSEAMAWTQVDYDAPLVRMEEALMRLLGQPGQRIENAVARLAGHEGSNLPAGFESRLVQILGSEGIYQACCHASAGPSVRAGLAPMLRALPDWASSGVPDEQWREPLHAWGLEVTQRIVWLRLCSRMPSPLVAALLCLCGALIAKWVSHGDEQRYANVLAAWCRAIRSPMFWTALLPEPASVQWLLRGARL